MTFKQVDSLMNKSSGMLGLTETSNDLREITMEAEHGSEAHRLALDIFCYRVKKYVGAYAAAMGGLEALVFTAGIGERSSYVRKKALENMQFWGIEIDNGKNDSHALDIGKGKVRILVIPTNEELAIGRDTLQILTEHRMRAEDFEKTEAPSEETQTLDPDDSAELLALWLRRPRSSAAELAKGLLKRTGHRVGEATVRRQMELWGLDRVSVEKREELLARSH